MPAFPALPARRRTRSRCTQTGTGQHPPRRCWLAPATRGVCIRLSRAACASRTPANGSPLAGAVAGRVPVRVRRWTRRRTRAWRTGCCSPWTGRASRRFLKQADAPGPQAGPSRL